MKISANGNTGPNSYQLDAIGVLESYETFLSATPNDIVLALSFSPLDVNAHYALDRSASTLGFGEGRVGYATIMDPSGASLSEDDLWTLIEGLDPLCLIITDAVAKQLVELAYRHPLEAKGIVTVGGRRTVAFDDLATLLTTEAGKQQVWHALKRLPIR